MYFFGRAYALLFSFITGIALLIFGLLVFLLPENDQPALTAPLVCLSVIFSIFWCIPLARDRFDRIMDWFHPSILFLLMYFAYLVFSGVWLWLYHNYDSIWINLGNRPAFVVNTVFFLGAVSIFSFGLGMRVKLPMIIRPISELFGQIAPFRRRETRYIILLFLITGGVFKIYHLSLYGPLSTDILRYLSPSAHRALGISISQFIIMLESTLDWAALLSVFYYVVRYKETNRKNGWWLVLFLVVIVALLDYIVSAKRSGVIPLFLLPLIWYHYIIKRLSAARAVIFSLAGMLLIVGLLMARIVLPLLAQNLVPTNYIGKNPPEVLAFYVDTGEWATFDMMAASIVQRDELLKQAGGTLFGFLRYSFHTLIVVIPRAIWPGKPGYEDLSQVYYRVLIGSTPGVGFAPTIWGSSFLLFHLAGPIIGFYLLGWLFRNIYAILQPCMGRPLNVFLYSIFYWMTFQFLRFGTTGFVILLFVQSLIVGVFAILLLWRRRRKIATRPAI